MQPVSRREFFRITGASAAAGVGALAFGDVLLGAAPPAMASPGALYLSDPDQLATLAAAVDQLVPGIGTPPMSASQLGVVDYINHLLSGFDGAQPDGAFFSGLDDASGSIYPSGPYRVPSGAEVSGSPPFVETGGPGFYAYQALSTVKAIGWRKQVDSWRQLYTSGIAYLDARAAALYPPAGNGPGAFARAGAAQTPPVPLLGSVSEVQVAILEELDYSGDPFFAALYDHTMEGVYSHPVYGGNAGYFAWQSFGFGGDVNGVRFSGQQVSGSVPASLQSPTPAGQPWLPTTKYTEYDSSGNPIYVEIAPQGAWAVFGGYSPSEMIAPGYPSGQGPEPTEDPTTTPTPTTTNW